MSVGQALSQHFNPELFKENQETMRLQMQRQTLSAAEQAQLAQAQQFHADTLAQQQVENNRQAGEDVWSALKAGATFAAPGQQPDFTVGNRGFITPRTHTIHKDSAVGQSLGLDEDLTGLSTDEYAHYVLPQLERLSVDGDKKAQLEANGRAVETQMPSNIALIQRRFSPSYYQPLGAVDPMADSLSANFIQRLKDAGDTDRKKGDQAATSALMKSLSDYRSPWEEQRQQQLNRQVEINARAAQNATSESDRSYQYSQNELNHMAAPVETQARELGQLQSTLAQATPAADALVAPQLIRVIGQMNRSSEPEMQRVLGGRSGWQSFLALAQHWSTDPASANSITPAQRQQMQGLLNVVQQKVQSKLDSLNQGFSDLTGSRDVMQHRKIVDRTRRAVSDVDLPSGSNDPVVNDLAKRYK
jgi:hypothetical protein